MILQKFASTTRSRVITLIHSSRACFDFLSIPKGRRKIPTPVLRLLVPQPKILTENNITFFRAASSKCHVETLHEKTGRAL